MTNPKFTVMSPIPRAVEFNVDQSGDTLSNGIELIIERYYLPNLSLVLPLTPCAIHYVEVGRPLPSPLPDISLNKDAIIIFPLPSSYDSIKSLFNKHNKPAPQAFIYENIKLLFNGDPNPPDGHLKEWFNHSTKAGLNTEHQASNDPAIRLIPKDPTDKFTIKTISQEGRFLDPAFVFKFLKQKQSEAGDFTFEERIEEFLSKLQDYILIELRNEWNEPYEGPYQGNRAFEITDPSGVTASAITGTGFVEIPDTGLVKIPSQKIVPGTYTIRFVSEHISVAPFNGKSSTNEYSFTVTEGQKTDYVSLQAINLHDWFVVEEDFGLDASDVSRHDYKSGNEVMFFVDGEDYFKRIYELLSTNQDDIDYVFFTDWRLDFDFDLLAISEKYAPPSNSTIGSLLSSDALGTKVFGILWDQKTPIEDDFVYTAQNYINDDAFVLLNSSIRYSKSNMSKFLRVLLDSRESENIGWSHHQKTFLVKKGNDLYAFCGGLDFAFKRWDTPKHRYEAGNRYLPKPLTDANYLISLKAREAHLTNWHDVQLEIRGPATEYVDRNFRQRWLRAKFDNPYYGLHLRMDEKNGKLLSDPSLSWKILREELPSATYTGIQSEGDKFVRIATTYNSQNKFTIMQNLTHCIRRAKRYIYIEDQYLISYNIADALKQRLEENQKLIVIIVTGKNPEIPGAVTRRNKFLKRLGYDDLNPRITVCHLENEYIKKTKKRIQRIQNEIYVHSKMMIIDDIWVYVGSANLNNRSLTADTELGAMIIDGQLQDGYRKFALEFRKALWEEHLGEEVLSYERLLAYEELIDMWKKAAKNPRKPVISLCRETKKDKLTWLADDLVEPWGANGPITDPDGGSFNNKLY